MYSNTLIYRSPLLQVPMTKKNAFKSIILDTINKSIDEKSKKLNKSKNGIFNNNINLNININIQSSGNIKRSKYTDFFQYLRKTKKNSMNNYKIYKQQGQTEENGKLIEMLKNNNSISANGTNSMNKRIGSALSSRSNDAIQIGTTFITLDGIKRQILNSDLNLQKERKKLSRINRNNNNNINKEKQNFLSTNNSVESQQNTIEKEIISSSLNKKKEASFIIKNSQYGKHFQLNFIPLLFGNERYNNYHQGIKTNANVSNINFKNKYLISLLNKNNNIKCINSTSKRNLILQKNKSFKDKNKLILQKILLKKKSMSKNNIFSKPVLKKDVGTDTCDIKFHQPKPELHSNNNDFSDKIDNDKPKLPSIRKRKKIINSNNLKIGKILEGINNKELMPEIIKKFYKDKKEKGYASFIPNKEFNTLFLKRYHKKYNKNEENNNSNNSNKEKI